MEVVVPPRICLSRARKTVSFETNSRSIPKPGDVAGSSPPPDGMYAEEDDGEHGRNDVLLAAVLVPLSLRKSLLFRGDSAAVLLSLSLSPPPLCFSSSSKRMDGIVGAVAWDPPPRPPPLASSSKSSSCCRCSSHRQSSTYRGFRISMCASELLCVVQGSEEYSRRYTCALSLSVAAFPSPVWLSTCWWPTFHGT